MTITPSHSAMDKRRLIRVLADDAYPTDFNIDLGQANSDLTKRRLTTHYRLPKYRQFNIHALTLDRGFGFDLLHMFNAVPVRSWKPFLVTFESALPRVWELKNPTHRKMFDRLTRKLCSDKCRALLALSRYALRDFAQQHQGEPYFDSLWQKTRLVYPSVKESPALDVPMTDDLRVFFVGRDYMRKGMPIITRAHKRLVANGVPIRTTIVSSLRWLADDYIGPGEGYNIDAERALLDQPGIEHHESLPNEDVMQRVAASHFSLLPTMHDTFGYSVLESFSRATPVIGTDTCALPELIEHGRSGYLLPFENDSVFRHWSAIKGRWADGYNDRFRDTVEAAAESLADVLQDVWERRGEYGALREGALARCRSHFDREQHRRVLEAVYDHVASPGSRPLPGLTIESLESAQPLDGSAL